MKLEYSIKTSFIARLDIILFLVITCVWSDDVYHVYKVNGFGFGNMHVS